MIDGRAGSHDSSSADGLLKRQGGGPTINMLGKAEWKEPRRTPTREAERATGVVSDVKGGEHRAYNHSGARGGEKT